MQDFHVESITAFVVFHGLVWASWLVIAGVMLAFRRRMTDRAAISVQQFGQDMLPLILLFAISVTGLLLTVSYTWMKGYAYDFLAIRKQGSRSTTPALRGCSSRGVTTPWPVARARSTSPTERHASTSPNTGPPWMMPATSTRSI